MAKKDVEPMSINEQDTLLGPLVQRIVSRFDPEEVWLFGSRYRGDSTRLSDWDLLILVQDDDAEHVYDPYYKWETHKDSGLSADLVIDTMENFYSAVDVPNSLAREIKDERRLLYKR